MPLPMPHSEEEHDVWMSRCMGHETMMADYPSQDQRLAVCFRQWRTKGAGMDDVETKSFGPLEIKEGDKGEVIAVVATLNVVDRDGDVILTGAIPPGSKVKLSGYSHDTVLDGAAPVGKGTISEENGKAVFRGNFFMSTERGRESFHMTKELGAEGDWSFGYPKRVRTAELTDEWRTKGARRLISGMLPMEASPVLMGAGLGTGTVAIKAADPPGPTEAELSEAKRVAEEAETKRLAEEAEATARALEATVAAEFARFQTTEARERVRQADLKRAAEEAEVKRLAAEATEEFARFEKTNRWLGLA